MDFFSFKRFTLQDYLECIFELGFKWVTLSHVLLGLKIIILSRCYLSIVYFMFLYMNWNVDTLVDYYDYI